MKLFDQYDLLQIETSKMVISFEKVVNAIFLLLCLSLAIHFVSKQIFQYRKNDDKSSISFKRYHTTKDDKYPTFSVCFSIDGSYPETLFQDDIIKAKLDIDASDYHYMLIGLLKGKTNFSLLEYDEAKWDLLLMFEEFLINTFDGNPVVHWTNDNHETSQAPFFTGYQDPMELCLTRNNNFSSKITIHRENLKLLTKNWIGTLTLYMHYPGQLMSVFNRRQPIVSIDLSDSPVIPNSFSIGITQLQILRKRQDSVAYCNPDLNNDLDTRWRETFMYKSNCIPTYWKLLDKSLNFNEKRFNDCSTSEDYLDLGNDILKLEEVEYEESCTWPTIISSVKKDSLDPYDSSVVFDILHNSEYYLEIKNSRNINTEDLWSQIGGLIGIFLGYSLLQVPNIVLSMLRTMLNCLNKFMDHFMIHLV